ncbi:MAG: hypothetical protein WDW38_005758 [Sanguina aurantia]
MGLEQLWSVLTRDVSQPLFPANPSAGSGSSSSSHGTRAGTILAPPAASHQRGTAADASPAAFCIIIDSISSLFQRYTTPAVLRLLERLRHHPGVSGILGLLHADLQPPHVSRAIEHMASCCAQLLPVTRLQQEAVRQQLAKLPSGRLQLSFKRRTGRVRVEQRLYSLTHHATGCSSVEVLSMTVGMDLATQALLATGLLSAQGEANTQRAPPTHPTPPTTAAPPTPLPAPPSVPAATPTHSQAAADASRQQQLQQSAPSVASVGGSRGGVRGSTAAGSGGEVGGGGEGSGERPGAALAGGMKLGLTDQVGCVCC